MEEQATLTINVTYTLKSEPGLTYQQKEEQIKQQLQDQVAAVMATSDYGVAALGTIESSLTETVNVEEAKPDYEG